MAKKIKTVRQAARLLQKEARHLSLARDRILLESRQALREMRTRDERIKRAAGNDGEVLRLFRERLDFKLYLDDLLRQSRQLEDQGVNLTAKVKRLQALQENQYGFRC